MSKLPVVVEIAAERQASQQWVYVGDLVALAVLGLFVFQPTFFLAGAALMWIWWRTRRWAA